MKQKIPETIKPFQFATKSLKFLQDYQIKDFPRINTLASNSEAIVAVELNFSLEFGKIPCVKGEIELDVVLDCQRCLNEVSIHLQPNFKLAFLQNEQQGEELNLDFETILDSNEEFSSIDFITDEILISIPMIPMHDYTCVFTQNRQAIKEQKRKNPFAILKNITNKE